MAAHEPNRTGAKITLGSIATLVGIMIAIQPYLDLKTLAAQHSAKIEKLEQQARVDHDLIIQIAADVGYMRREMDKKP